MVLAFDPGSQFLNIKISVIHNVWKSVVFEVYRTVISRANFQRNRVHKFVTFHWTNLYQSYFPVVLFILLYKAVLSLGSVGEILKCDHSTDSF